MMHHLHMHAGGALVLAIIGLALVLALVMEKRTPPL